MPDLRFLSEAAFFIGCGVGFLSGTLVSWTLHAWTLAGMEKDRPFEGGRLKAFEKEKRWINGPVNGVGGTSGTPRTTPNQTKKVTHGHRYVDRAIHQPALTSSGEDHQPARPLSGSAESRRVAARLTKSASRRPEITPLNLNPNQERRLVWLILNETRRNANDLPREDVELKLETLARYKFGSKVRRRVRDEIITLRLGWKDDAGTVYLSRHKAREFVARARRAGVIGGR